MLERNTEKTLDLSQIFIAFYNFMSWAVVPLSLTKSKEKCAEIPKLVQSHTQEAALKHGRVGRKQWETTKRKESLTHERQDKHDTEKRVAVTAQSLFSLTVEKAVKNTEAVEAKKKKRFKNEPKSLFPPTAQ